MNAIDRKLGTNEKGEIIDDEAMETLKADLAALRSDIETLKNDVVKHGRRAGEAAADRIEDELDALNQRASEVLGSARRRTAETTDDVRETVRENPMTAVGAALAVGMLFGQLLGRR